VEAFGWPVAHGKRIGANRPKLKQTGGTTWFPHGPLLANG
jgi:hypothetical protein